MVRQGRFHFVGTGIAWVTLLIATGLVILSAYWMVCPNQGFIIENLPFTIEKGVVAQGELQTYHVHYCVQGTLPMYVNVDRGLTNTETELLFPLPSTIGHQVKVRCEEQSVAIGIPIYLPPGRYRLTIGTQLQVNPLRTVHQEWTTEEFTVVPFRGLPGIHPSPTVSR